MPVYTSEALILRTYKLGEVDRIVVFLTRDRGKKRGVEPTRSPLSGPGSDALGYVGYFAELIDEWAPEAHPDERLFRLGASITDAIATGAMADPLARYFEYWLLRLQGVYPSLMSCAGCAAPLVGGAVMPAREDVFVCPTCAPTSGTRVSIDALKFLKAAGATSPDRLETLPLEPRASRELETVHRRLLNLHLEKELKSARVLRELRHTR
jgi:DNA repair protein RecO (recombination protein O)